SSVWNTSSNNVTSLSMPSDKLFSTPSSTAFFNRDSDCSDFPAILLANSIAVFNPSPVETTLLMRPISSALLDEIGSPVNIISFALALPIRRGNRCVPPPPGKIPRLTSGSPICVCSSAIRISNASASSQPPPSVKPSNTMMVGFVMSSRLVKTSCIAITSSRILGLSIMFGNSLISAPAINTLSPVVVNTTQIISSSFSDVLTVYYKEFTTNRINTYIGGFTINKYATPSSLVYVSNYVYLHRPYCIGLFELYSGPNYTACLRPVRIKNGLYL